MIDSSQIRQISTASTSLQGSKFLNVYPKIIGYIPYLECNSQNLIPLQNILPASIELLNFILLNLVSIILEIIKRDLPTPDLNISKIMINQEDFNCGIPYIQYKQDNTIAKNCEEKLWREFQILCFKLSCDQDLVNSDNLYKIQEHLLLKLNFQQDSLKNNSQILQHLLKITKVQISETNDLTQVHIAQTPKFLSKICKEDKIAIKVTQQNWEDYELREIQIIEEFNNDHLPHLYGYLRYYDILVLFLKKHDLTFSKLQLELYKKRRELKDQIQQILLKLFRQMVKAVSVAHDMGIIHRDLKPENIMFDLEKPIDNYTELLNISVTCVLIDFDRSIMQESDQPKKKSYYTGTPLYRPPEGVQSKYHSSYDIWQLGLIWILAQKQYFNKNSQIQSQLLDIQKLIEGFNSKILKLQEEMDGLNKRKICENEKLILKNQYLNDIIHYQNQKKETYSKLIQKINTLDNCYPYHDELQGIIRRMIEFDPYLRPDLSQILAVLDTIIK